MDDPRAYLETEARIIAEDDTHAVIAVRVEKHFRQKSSLAVRLGGTDA